MRILVVEDDRGTAGFIKKGFSEQGCAVDTRHNDLSLITRNRC